MLKYFQVSTRRIEYAAFHHIAVGPLLRFVAMASQAQETSPDPRITPAVLAAFEPHLFEDGSAKSDIFRLSYRVIRPLEEEAGQSYPLILFLHGKGERGDDNQRQLIHGGRWLVDEQFRRERPAFVVTPQCPAGTEPGSKADRLWTTRPKRGSAVKILLDRKPTRQLRAVQRL